MNYFIFSIGFLVGQYFLLAQEKSNVPVPAIGWDSLQSLINYPDIARRAGVEGDVNATVHIDKNGNVVAVNVKGDAGILENHVKRILMKTRWIPAKEWMKKIELRFVFQFTESLQKTLLIEAKFQKREPVSNIEHLSPKIDTIP